jgi:large subunit ribosomal protein L23
MAVFSKKTSGTKGAKAPAEVNFTHGARLVPLVSEKAERLRQKNQYAFASRNKLSKVEVKKAVETAFGVHVMGVNSVLLPRKTVRRGRATGTTKPRRRYIVRIKAGENIDVTKAI